MINKLVISVLAITWLQCHLVCYIRSRAAICSPFGRQCPTSLIWGMSGEMSGKCPVGGQTSRGKCPIHNLIICIAIPQLRRVISSLLDLCSFSPADAHFYPEVQCPMQISFESVSSVFRCILSLARLLALIFCRWLFSRPQP